MSNVLVTGGLGFIGSYTVDELIKSGYKVTVLDNLERQVHGGRIPEYLNKKAIFIKGDIRDKKSWIKALDNVDYIIHLAATVGVGQSFWSPKKYTDVNASGTANLFEILTREKNIRKKIQKVVVASSKSIYGEGTYECSIHGTVNPEPRSISQLKNKDWEMRCPICGEYVKPISTKEDKPAQNLSPYALSKYYAERIAIDYSNALDIPAVEFRYFNAYGPRQSLNNPYTGVMAIFISRLKNKNPPIIFEDGKQMRDFIFVEDIAKINKTALEKGNGVYNVGTGKPTSLLSILVSLEKLLDVKIEPKITNDFRPGDNRHDFADLSNFTKVFGSFDFTDVYSGLGKLVEWSNSQDAKDLFEKEEKERKEYLK